MMLHKDHDAAQEQLQAKRIQRLERPVSTSNASSASTAFF
jgi:hypothetical protein